MDHLRVCLLQADLIWEDKAANLEKFAQWLPTLPETDLIILPEMFSTGFSMRPEILAEDMSGQTVGWLKQQAKAYNSLIISSLIIAENGRYYNRLLAAYPNGELAQYDKRHLFGLGGEHSHYQAGQKKLVIEYLGWKIAPFVCYDLRFPVWSRNVENYDLAVYVANWPDRRISHWEKLLPARAVENQCFVAAVNRVGLDGHGLAHSGSSAIYDPNGEILEQLKGKEGYIYQQISKQSLQELRAKLPFLSDRDQFEIL